MTKLIVKAAFFISGEGKISTDPLVIDSHHPALGTLALPNQVIMPGFVNTHSHVFQRLLRGLVEKSSTTNTFWSWREAMYKLANRISPMDLQLIAQLVYLEMLEAGFTDVGEFHYLHHDQSGKKFDDPLAMSRALAAAAKKIKIHLCLLSSAYHQSHFNTPALPEQRRFIFNTAEEFLSHAALVEQELSGAQVSTGIAIHSVRAVPPEWFAPILERVIKSKMPLHIHASEQSQEVKDCLQATGHSPIAWLAHHNLISPQTTLIHATQLIEGDRAYLEQHRPLISICPSTERNLGDGIIALKELFEAGLKICVGSDQHVRLDPFHEAQCLEEHERLRLKERSVLNRDGDWLYKKLLPCLTVNGLNSLYPQMPPQIAPNYIGIELPPEYEWHGPEVAMEALFLAGNTSNIKTVISNGHIVVQDGCSTYGDKFYLYNEVKKFLRSIA